MADSERRGPAATVLVVDDDRLVLSSIQKMLELQGHRVLGVSSGWGAVELLQSDTRVDLLLVDLVLEDASGAEVIEHARRLRPDLPVIAMSGYGRHVADFTEIPEADAYLGKPFDNETLLEWVGRLLARAPGARREGPPPPGPAPRPGAPEGDG
ncbi:MAG: response regulator, partial [Acidobacteria bacterium]